VAILVASFAGTAECGFKREAVYQVKFFPHDDSGGRFPRFLNYKVAVIEGEVFRIL